MISNFKKLIAFVCLCAMASLAVAEESETWKSLGKALFRDDCFTTPYIVKNHEYEVEVEECQEKPGLYRLVSPYRNYPLNSAKEPAYATYMLVDAQNPEKVYIPEMYDTEFLMYGEEVSYVIFSKSGYALKRGDITEANANYGKVVDGVITFPAGALLISNMTPDAGASSWDRMYQLCNSKGKFRIVLPTTKRLDSEILLGDGKVEQGDKFGVSVNFVLGRDCAELKVAMFEGAFDSKMVAAVKTAVAGVDGVADVKTVTASGETVFSFEKNGVYTFVGVPYVDGTPNELRYCYTELQLDYYPEGWKSLGFGTYTEGILVDNEVSTRNEWPLESVTYEVEVQESESRPGVFRLVNPYGLNYKYSSESTYDQSRNYYMVIDASRAGRAVIKKMEDAGLKYGGYNFAIWSNADRRMEEDLWTEEEITSKYDWFGTRKENEITFPKDALCIKFSAVSTWYYANSKGRFKVVLPEGASKPPVAVDNVEEDEFNGTPEYFTIQGVRIEKEDLQPGNVYIIRRGSKVTKEYISEIR